MKHLGALCAVATILLAASAAWALAGDYNNDGVIDETDQAILMNAIRTRAGEPGFVADADHDGDGVITMADLGTFLRLKGQQTSQP